MNEENKCNYYSIIPATVRYDYRLKPAEKILYGELTALSNKEGYCFAQNNDFQIIAKFLNDASLWKEYDLVVIDECSTVSDIDMKKLLNILNTKLLVLVGYIYQIDSITFGNWFKIAKSVMPKYAVHELTKAYRSGNEHLQVIWDKVRNCEDDILEYLTKYEYTIRLNESILSREGNDEIILCLNYDGLYGINNINRFLQNSNPNPSFEWGIGTYKVGDPILFNEFSKFSRILYNNLKGKILEIKKKMIKNHYPNCVYPKNK